MNFLKNKGKKLSLILFLTLSAFLVILFFIFKFTFFNKNKTNNNTPLNSAAVSAKQVSKVDDLPTFIDSNIKPNSVVILEFNPFHHECIPGFAKYFLDLGYNVDVLLLKSYEDCFSIFKETEKVHIFTFNDVKELEDNKEKLHDKFKTYSKFFLNTTYPKMDLESKLGLLDLPNAMYVSHTLENATSNELKNKNIVMLGEFLKGTYVNPHFFGEVKDHSKNKKTNFAVIGNIETCRRNYGLLMETVRSLKSKKYNFTVTVIGRYSSLDSIPEDIRDCFDFKGRVSYSEMYNIVKETDFILMLLDPTIPAHLEYKKSLVSGNIQLSYGFSKPCLINKEFAPYYKLNKNNSLIYSKNNLLDSMVTAIKMTEKEYSDIRENLKQTAKEIYKTCLSNLKKLLS